MNSIIQFNFIKLSFSSSTFIIYKLTYTRTPVIYGVITFDKQRNRKFPQVKPQLKNWITLLVYDELTYA